MYLRIKPRKRTIHTGSCAKLAPQYCGPFEVLEQVGPVAYKFAMPSHVKVHNYFHFSLCKKSVHDTSHVVDWTFIWVETEGCFLPEPLRILGGKKLCSGIEQSLT